MQGQTERRLFALGAAVLTILTSLASVLFVVTSNSW